MVVQTAMDEEGRLRKRFGILMVLSLIMMVSILSACSDSDENADKELALAPESALPDFVRDAPPQVKEAYRFAIANPDVLAAFPCYCGCGQMGHENNLGCYIKEMRPDGSMVFENHAFG
jgi:hypothetical protein